MNEAQIKTKIFLLKAVDWGLLIAALSVGIYTFLYSENINFMATITLAGLFLVNRLGHITINKIAVLSVTLKQLQRTRDKKNQ